MMHMSLKFTFTERKSARLSGDPFTTEIFGKFRRVFHSLLMYSTLPTITTCFSSWKWKLEALRGITKFLKPIRGLSGSANRQTTTCPFRTVIAAWFRSRMHSSRLLEGVQWNMPVLSYFISVFSKSKSALSGAMTVWPFLMASIRIGGLSGEATSGASSFMETFFFGGAVGAAGGGGAAAAALAAAPFAGIG